VKQLIPLISSEQQQTVHDFLNSHTELERRFLVHYKLPFKPLDTLSMKNLIQVLNESKAVYMIEQFKASACFLLNGIFH